MQAYLAFVVNMSEVFSTANIHTLFEIANVFLYLESKYITFHKKKTFRYICCFRKLPPTLHKIFMSKSTMEIKFEGKSHQISAELLIASLVNYQTVIEIANRMLGQGERKIDVKVNATKEGSFVLDISLEQSIIESLFSNESVSYLANLTTVVGGVYGLYKVFGGRKINESDKIPNNLGIKKEDLNITVNVYNNKESRRCISETIKKVKDESQSEGISYSFGNGDDVQ